ncbi:cell wall metabolism sensor histidine kinase WalK [Evansella cellulosilytica]|uniref:histidine kinase n=1 Tax=Evansella cellulosilytica (strain ATCC 21833 / DSM 2522 / FERM P-1141 / JCM 9156 / N-4) TaxID=649639 RepID=E6TZW6_EVAC2|nr:cell wall metabolism sensor histidine kinase WalK [Evansella cellulosilytica]ADU32532.1 multi-sensor signal transduction histidine kinase [Evansella cellulosilytica DSM 2522]
MNKIRFYKSIHVKIVIIYVLLILIAMQVIGVYFTGKLDEYLQSNFNESLTERVNLLSYNVAQEISRDEEDEERNFNTRINSLLRDLFDRDTTLVQIIDKNNTIIGVSNPRQQPILGQRTTNVYIKRALIGTGMSQPITMTDPTTGPVGVIAVPVILDDEVVGAIYIEASMQEIYDQMQQINQILMTGTIMALAITAILGVLLAQTITRPIVDMKKQAVVMGQGDFTRKVKVYGDDEIGQLASAFNVLTKKLQEANETTEGEKRKLSSVLTHMTDGVIATDRLGKVILMNKRAEQLLGHMQDDVLGIEITKILNLDKFLTLDDLYTFKDPILLDFDSDEEEVILEAHFSVIEKEAGAQNGLIAVLHDVTEQERIEEERREFVANVSHELRTPLTSMKSYLEALADGAINDSEVAPRFIHVTQTETERMIRLVNDLLQLSKMDSKDYSMNVVEINLPQFMDQIIERFEMATKNESISFKRRLTVNTDIIVFGDRDKLTQLLDNILSNAVKYSPEGGTILCSLKIAKDNVIVSIKDEGVGIPKENIPYVFDRFYRVDKARSRNLGGTGLGLAIAKEIVHAHGGSIWVSSDWGRGTTISFSLPFDEAVNVND